LLLLSVFCGTHLHPVSGRDRFAIPPLTVLKVFVVSNKPVYVYNI